MAALTGVLPSNDEKMFRQRASVVEQLAATTSTILEHGNSSRLERHLKNSLSGPYGITDIRVTRFDGVVLFQTPGFTKHWTLAPGLGSTIDQMRVPIQRSQKDWALVEIAFAGQEWHELGWVRIAGLILIAFAMNGLSFVLFLRRALSVLEPTNTVPRRVRNTLDTIAGGVVVMDAQGKIMLANESFSSVVSGIADKIIGSSLSELPWRIDNSSIIPWELVLLEKRRSEGTQVYLPLPDGSERCFVVNATPVLDANERLAGALVSFEDVTALEEQRKNLVDAMNELQMSKEQIRQQNERLQELASKDALTGAYNRRALYEQMEAIWIELPNQPQGMVAIMMDIDHFKKLNDTHGHAAGDNVLKDVVKVLHTTVADRGVVGRYGGEEFCVILRDCSLEEGLQMGEKIRAAIERDLAKPYAVTTSVGLSSSLFGAESVKRLLEQADKSLYAAKHGGRNRVKNWSPDIDTLEDNNQKKALLSQNLSMIDDHPVSYHAVVSLHAALTYKHADTALHTQRVAEMSVSLGRGLMPVNELYVLEIAALLHDVGKIGVPDAVLTKPGRLTDEEWRLMEAHGPIGVSIVESAFNCPQITNVLKYHHCRFDGSRQDPSWPKGKDIPLEARIVSITDAFDAMVSDRCYRKGMPYDDAFTELKRCAGTQFDPDLVERFTTMQFGFRPDSRFMSADNDLDKDALNIGYHVERVIHSFENRDPASMKQRLDILKACAMKCGMPHIAHLVADIAKDADRKAIGDWETLLPILQELVDLCLTIQRAYIRQVGYNAIHVEDCSAQDYMKAQRYFGEAPV